MTVIVKLTHAEVVDALHEYAKKKLAGTQLIADEVIINYDDTYRGNGNTVSADVSFKPQYSSSYYDR
jgi:hypothetical protein